MLVLESSTVFIICTEKSVFPDEKQSFLLSYVSLGKNNQNRCHFIRSEILHISFPKSHEHIGYKKAHFLNC